MTFLAFILLLYPTFARRLQFTTRVFLKEAIFYGSSIIIFLTCLTTLITYIDQRALSISNSVVMSSHLPGMRSVKETLFYAVPIIAFYSFFFVHICSFVLRILLNWYHFSINELGRIPRIISFFGPLVCQYQYWYDTHRWFME